MAYTGRLTITLLACLNYAALLVWKGYTFEHVTLAVFLVSGVVQALVSWWLGLQYDRARYFSHKDALTGTYNRRFLNVLFPKLQAKADRNDTKVSVLMLDADQFKSINDVYGHKVGDAAMKHIAEVLFDEVRHGDFIARMGGDEFLILAPDTDSISVKAFAMRIESGLEAQTLHGMEEVVSVSIGTATYPDDAQNFDDLLRVADHRMYAKKAARRARHGDREGGTVPVPEGLARAEVGGMVVAPRHVVAVSALVRNTEGNCLLVRTHWRSDTWELPGGQVEEGEAPDEAVRREVLEETGIAIRPISVTGIYYNTTSTLLSVVFIAQYIDGTITLQHEELKEARFIPLTEENIEDYIIRPHMRSRALDALRNRGHVPYETWTVGPYRRMSRLE